MPRDVNLTWDDLEGEDQYYLYRATGVSPSFPGDFTQIDTLPINTTSYYISEPNNTLITYALTGVETGTESPEATTQADTRINRLKATPTDLDPFKAKVISVLPWPINIDTNSVNQVTVDGTSVTQITVDGTPLRGPSDTFYGFESGDTSNWTNGGSSPDFAAVTNRANSGTYSGYFGAHDDSGSNWHARTRPRPNGKNTKWSSYGHSFNESSSAYGHAVILYDLSGSEVLRLGSSNIDAQVKDGNGTHTVGSGWTDYNEWITWDVTFDWQNGQYSLTVTDGNNTSSRSNGLMSSNGIYEVKIWAANSIGDLRTRSLDNWFDDFEWIA